MKEEVLFDYVLVVGLQNEGGVNKSFISYRFPPAQEKDTLADAIQQFCFPEAEQWLNPKLAKAKAKSSETFNFVLTDTDGSRRFGYCRRLIVHSPKGDLVPECFCILSLVPSASLFYEMLNIVEELRKRSSSAVFSFLKSVLAKSFPKPGQTLSIRTFDDDSFSLTRSDNDFMLDFASFTPLFRCLDTSLIVDLMAALLTECRIILSSKSVSTLSSCVNALTALIYPFTWQHVFIPILPKALMSYCCAPMPFLVGILSSNLSELNQYPMEEVVLLDLDTGKYLRDVPPSCDAKKTLPDSAEALKTSLNSIWKKDKSSGNRSKDTQIAQECLNFFYLIFGSFENFFSGNSFDRKRFFDHHSDDTKKFLTFFQETQMFEMFVKELETLAATQSLHLCALSTQRFTATHSKSYEQKSTKECRKCGKEVTPQTSKEVVKKNKTYCLNCWDAKEKKKKERFSNVRLKVPSMPSLPTRSSVHVEGGSKSTPNLNLQADASRLFDKASTKMNSFLYGSAAETRNKEKEKEKEEKEKEKDKEKEREKEKEKEKGREEENRPLKPKSFTLRPRGSKETEESSKGYFPSNTSPASLPPQKQTSPGNRPTLTSSGNLLTPKGNPKAADPPKGPTQKLSPLRNTSHSSPPKYSTSSPAIPRPLTPSSKSTTMRKN